MKRVTKEELLRLARLQCSMQEFCCAFEVSHETIYNKIREFYDMTFAQFVKHYGAGGHTSLRRAMWAKALKGDTKLMMFLAQNHLGMSEKTSSELELIPAKLTTIIDDIYTPEKEPSPAKTKDKNKRGRPRKPSGKRSKK